ncbi:MAG: glycosyltransferase family 9 protein [Gemmataceae bacterium]
MPRRIAILKPSALGDIVHALPVLTALRERFPDARISWVVNKGFEPLLAGHPHLDETLPFDRGAFRGNAGKAVTYSLRFADVLRKRRFDLVIDLQGLLRTGLMSAATGAAVRVGFANAREGSRHFYTRRVEVPDADRIHAVDRYWRVAESLGAGDRPKRFVVPVRADEAASVRRELAHLPRPWVAVAAGAKWVTKRWPPAHFAALLNRMFAATGGSAVLVGAGDDTALSAEVAAGLRGPVADLTGKTPLPKLVAVLAAADVMLANDTGPLHLAAALGRPSVAPYLCTKVALHGPYGVPGGGVETAVPCGGSYVKQCPNGFVCFPDLTPDHLWGALAAALHANPNRSA